MEWFSILSFVFLLHTSLLWAWELQPSYMYKGVGYSGFRAQGPYVKENPEVMTAANIEQDMTLLQSLGVKWVRTYSTDLGGDLIPSIAKDHGMDTIIGTWVGRGEEGIAQWYNETARVEALIQRDPRIIPIVVIGNELLYENIQPAEKVLELVRSAKSRGMITAMGDIPPTLLNENLRFLFSEVDILMMHTHPYFSNIHTLSGSRIEKTRLTPDLSAADDVVQATLRLKEMYPGKLVVVGETGYPSGDDSPKDSPFHCQWCSETSQRRFFDALFYLAQASGLGVLAFEGFDEDFKGQKGDEAGSGPHWGLFHSDRSPKPVTKSVAKWLATNGPMDLDQGDLCEGIWQVSECQPKAETSDDEVRSQLNWACSQNGGDVDCGALQYIPIQRECPLRVKAAWAFSRYFYQQHRAPDACQFSNIAYVKPTDSASLRLLPHSTLLQTPYAGPSTLHLHKSKAFPVGTIMLTAGILLVLVVAVQQGVRIAASARRQLFWQTARVPQETDGLVMHGGDDFRPLVPFSASLI